MKIKYNILFLLLHLCCFAFSQQNTNAVYQTLANSGLTKQQADTMGYVYKVKFYENGILKKTEYCQSRRDSTGNFKPFPVIIDYYLSENEDIVGAEKKSFENATSSTAFNFIKTVKKDGYTIVHKVNDFKNDFGLKGTAKVNYIFDSLNRIIAMEEEKVINGKLKQINVVKNLYDELGNTLLICSYTTNSCSVFSGLDHLPVEKFDLKEFDTMKKKYFPFQNIDYYKYTVIDPRGFSLNSITHKNKENTEFKTEIGTETDEGHLPFLHKYSKWYYKKKKPVKIELFEEQKVTATHYYVEATENHESMISKHKNESAYAAIKFQKAANGKSLEIMDSYIRNEFAGEVLKLKDTAGHIISEEYFKHQEKQPQVSKTKKRYYDANGLVLFESTYLSDGTLNQILLYNNDELGIITRFGQDEWTKFKNYYFPNDDISFYKTASPN